MSTVLFLDSGVGGLSVWQETVARLPHSSYIYAFDNLFFPYGEKEDSTIIERCCLLVRSILRREHADMIVVACNTASTVALPALRAEFSLPVVGVVPAVKPAAAMSRSKVIGLLATPATVRRRYIDDLVANFAADCTVVRLGSLELVQIAEEKMRSGMVSVDAVRACLRPLGNADGLDTLVLGCTHFPWLRSEIQECLGQGIACVDSGQAVARRICSLLPPGEKSAANGGNAFRRAYQTDGSGDYRELFTRIGFGAPLLLRTD